MTRWLMALCAGWLLGCAAQHARAPQGLPARAIAERIARAAAAPPSVLVIAIERSDGNAKPQLIAYDVASKALRFRVAVEETAEASQLGDLLLVREGTTLRALDASDGRELYRLALAEGRYAGAARAGERIGYALVHGRALDPEARCDLMLIDARSGARTGQLELPGDAGQPFAAGDFVLVPSQRQRIVVIDAARGEEVARLRAQSDAIEWLDVTRDPSGRPLLTFGGRGFHRLVPSEAQPSASFRLPDALSALPGRPSAPQSAYERHAGRRIGLYVAPVPVGASELGLLADRAYFVFYTLVFAFDGRGALVYARQLSADAVAARVMTEGLLVATAKGELALLSHRDGATLASHAMVGEHSAGLRSAELPERAPEALPASATSGADVALVLALIEAAGAEDSKLVPARIYAVEQLAKMQEAVITGALLELYERPNTPAELQSAIAAALSARRTGLSALVAALDRRYDFIEASRPAPLAIIAPALARGGEKAGAEGLLARLWDHETPVTALPSLARALGTLGDAKTAASLLEWIELYQADSSLREQPEALIEAARAALALDPKAGKPGLARLHQSGRMAAEPAHVIAALLAPPKPVVSSPAEVAVAAAPAVVLPRLPSKRAIDDAFAAQLEALKPCVAEELKQNPKLLQLRIAFVAEADGSAHAFHFAPASQALTDCLYPKVASIRLPAFSEPRSVEQVVINMRREAAPVAEPAKANGSEPWWAFRAGPARPKTQATPWWRIEQLLPPRLDASAGSALDIEAGSQPIMAPAPTAPAVSPAPAPPTAMPTPTAPTSSPAPAPPAASAADDQWWVPKAQ